MSWLSKVTDIAGAAESLLNRLDEKAGDAINTVQEQNQKRSRRQSSQSVAHTAVNIPEHVVTEDIGRPSNSIPSRAHSEYTGIRQKTPPEKSSRDNWSVVLNSRDVVSSEGGSRSRRSSGSKSFITVTDYEGDNQSNDACSVRSQIWAKDSQITVMKAKLLEMEKKFEKRSQEYFELKADKDLLEQRLATVVNTETQDTVEELKLSKKKAQEQKDQIIEERNNLRRKVVSLEEETRAMIEQLRLAKFNLNENKKEFDEYKNKAQKILSAKEKLVESLKNEHETTIDGPGPVLLAEVEELKVERDLAKSDLESCQLQLYTLRSDAEELDAQLRELKSQMSEQRRGYFEERQSWELSTTHLNEQVECARMESDFAKKELKKKTEEFAQKMAEKEAELRNAIDLSKNRRREEENRAHEGNAQMGELLLQKQKELEDAQRTNQVLTVRLDRLQRSQRDTTISMDQSEKLTQGSTQQFLSSVQNPQARQVMNALDSTAIKVMATLRTYPAARIFFIVYFIVLHFWLFFIILTYTPEAH